MFYWASAGWANYNAGFLSYRTRNFKGLTLDANITWAHSLDTRGLNQDFDTAASNSYDLHYDYGTSIFRPQDRLQPAVAVRVAVRETWAWSAELYREGLVDRADRQYLERASIEGLDGLQPGIRTGRQFQQRGRDSDPAEYFRRTASIPGWPATANPGGGQYGDPARGGTDSILFADPSAVFGAFRPAMVSLDTTSGAGGQLRGLPRWNVDLAISRKFRVTERWSATFSGQMFNTFKWCSLPIPP